MISWNLVSVSSFTLCGIRTTSLLFHPSDKDEPVSQASLYHKLFTLPSKFHKKESDSRSVSLQDLLAYSYILKLIWLSFLQVLLTCYWRNGHTIIDLCITYTILTFSSTTIPLTHSPWKTKKPVFWRNLFSCVN